MDTWKSFPLRPAVIAVVVAIAFFTVAANNSIIGDWFFSEDPDPITGELQYFLAATEKGTEDPYQSFGPFLGFVCFGSTFGAMVYTGEYLSSDEPVKVMYRVDSLDPYGPGYWEPTKKGTGVVVPYPHALAKKIYKTNASKVAFRVWDYNDVSYTFVFKTSGFREAIKPMPCATTVWEE